MSNESFPRFMSGVESVVQTDAIHTHRITKIGGVRREFDAEITEQHPDERIAWRSTGGEHEGGCATGPGTADGRQVKADTKRFKEFVEGRGTETGAWRGDRPAPTNS